MRTDKSVIGVLIAHYPFNAVSLGQMLSPEDVKLGRELGLAHHTRQVDFAPGSCSAALILLVSNNTGNKGAAHR